MSAEGMTGCSLARKIKMTGNIFLSVFQDKRIWILGERADCVG